MNLCSGVALSLSAIRIAAANFWQNFVKIKSVRLYSMPNFPDRVGWELIIQFSQSTIRIQIMSQVASKEAWPPGRGRGFCPSALL